MSLPLVANASPVLVAAPTYSGKEYARQEWMAGVQSQEYDGPLSVMLVDNSSDGGQYVARLRSEHPAAIVRYVEPGPIWGDVFGEAWTTIILRAVAGGFPWVLSLESDVILRDPDAVRLMVEEAERDGLLLLAHAYPRRPSTGLQHDLFEFGCTLFDTRLLTTSLFEPYEYERWFGTLWDLAEGHRVREYGMFEVDHLDDPDEGFRFAGIDDRTAEYDRIM